MLKVRVEARYEHSMAAVFAMLVHELGAQRWRLNRVNAGPAYLPRTGLRFGYRQARRLYSGEVLECLRPVSIALVERYQGPAGSIVARQRWCLDNVDHLTCLRGVLRLETNHFARLQLRFWKNHFAARLRRTCGQVRVLLEANARPQATRNGAAYSGSIGQNNGSASIVSANTSSVNGRPILR